MQKIIYKESPSPHVVIENFLSVAAARECLVEAQELEPVYKEASVSSEEIYEDDCDECLAGRNTSRKGIRQNKVVYLDSYYKEDGRNRFQSKTLQHLTAALLKPYFQKEFDSFPHLFPILAQTTHMETILSSYGKCDFYGWHKDVIPAKPASRILTCVLHFNTEPQQYEGGELILSGKTIEDQLAYPPVHNTAIFFESNKVVHAVDETRHEGEFKDSRFSINFWLGFSEDSNAYKYR